MKPLRILVLALFASTSAIAGEVQVCGTYGEPPQLTNPAPITRMPIGPMPTGPVFTTPVERYYFYEAVDTARGQVVKDYELVAEGNGGTDEVELRSSIIQLLERGKEYCIEGDFRVASRQLLIRRIWPVKH